MAASERVGVRYALEHITPLIAQEYLAKMQANRYVSPMHVDSIARTLTAGNWMETGDPIRFDWNEVLIDGQHRLRGVIKSGVIMRTLVARGLNPDVMRVIDTGRKRSFRDYLAMEKRESASFVASALRFLWMYEHGLSEGKISTDTPTHTELYEMLQVHQKIQQSVRWGSQCRKTLPPSLSIACHYLFARQDEDLAFDFFDGVARGLELDDGHPVWHLRQRAEHIKLSHLELLALTIKAFNFFAGGHKISRLVYRKGEPFPQIIYITE